MLFKKILVVCTALFTCSCVLAPAHAVEQHAVAFKADVSSETVAGKLALGQESAESKAHPTIAALGQVALSNKLDNTGHDMKKYQCHKIVQAMEVGEIQGLTVFDKNNPDAKPVTVSEGFFEKHNQSNQPGYLVRYEDGYLSWSPKEAFEAGYTELT